MSVRERELSEPYNFQSHSHSSSLSTASQTTIHNEGASLFYGDITEPTSPKLQEAAKHLSELVGSYDPDKLYHACLKLAVVIREADSSVLQLLLERDVVGVIVHMMESLPSHSSAQQAGCDALLSCNEQVELRSSVEDHNVYRCIFGAMKRHGADPYLAGKAVDTLASLSSTTLSDANLKENRAYSFVLSALKTHSYDVNVQCGGLLALANMLKTDTFAVSSIALQGDHRIILDSIEHHSSNPTVVAHGFQALQAITNESGVRRCILSEATEILSLVVEQLKNYSECEGVVMAGCGLLDALTEAEAETDIDDILTMTSSQPPSDVVSIASSTASTSSQAAFIQRVGHVKLLELLTSILKQFTGILEIQLHVLSSLEHLCALSTFETKVQDHMLEEWLYLLSDAFTNHSQEVDMQEVGCRCLARLLEIRPYLVEMIGDDKDRYQVPLHTRVWESVLSLLSLSGRPNPCLFKAVTWALYYLVETDESLPLQKVLVEKGVTAAVLETLREYIGEMTRNEQCVEYGCRALRGILMHPCKDSDKNYLINIGMVGDLKDIVDGFMYNADLIAEAFSVIACLSDMETFQKAVVDCSLHKPVLEAVERHSIHEILVESALEILIILTQNKNLQPVLNEADALGATVSIMKKHVVSPSIQCKGCMLIRFLACEYFLSSKSLCTAISKVVIAALAKRSDIRLQMEAVHCSQTLCVVSHQMAEAFVKADIHLILFNILYRDDKPDVTHSLPPNSSSSSNLISDSNDQEQQQPSSSLCGVRRPSVADDSDSNAVSEEKDFVFQVGTDIIYTLSFVWDFKQAMMTTAIKDGLTEGVKILIELGADVNAGEEAEMPICLAVQSGKKEMVELLLQKGATNTQKALELAREKHFDEIIGLVLAHIALEKSSEVVNLSGLELDGIKPTWILPSLGIYYSPPRRRISGHKRNRSLGQMKELILMRRQSVDLTSMTNGALLGMESNTGGRRSGTDEPESGVHTGLNAMRSGTGIGHRNENTPPSGRTQKTRMRIHSAVELLPSKIKSRKSSENSRLPVSQSSPLLSKRRLEFSDSQIMSGNVSHDESDREPETEPPLKVKLPEAVTPPSALPPSSRVRREGVTDLDFPGFVPTLSPIHGTPSHSLNRHEPFFFEEMDSGVENGPVSPVEPNNKQLLHFPSDDSLNSSTAADHNGSQSLNITPRSRRYRERKGTVTGARVLPFSNANDYLNRHRLQNVDSTTEASPSPAQPRVEGGKSRKEFSMSPTQFFNRFRKHREKRRGRKVSNSIFYTPRSSSPIAIMYPRVDYESSYNSDSNEFSFSKFSTKEKSTERLESGSFKDDDAFVAPNSSSSQMSSSLRADASLLAVSQKLQRLRKRSAPRQHTRKPSTGRECSPSSSSSSVMTTPSTSVSNSRRSSVDSYFFPPSSYRQSKDEVDYPGTYEAIPEESVTSEVSVIRERLVKMVDLSSNILTTLSDLAEAPGHKYVVRRMAEVCKLDLKQNQLESLPRSLMKELKMLTHLNLSCNRFVMFPLEAVLNQRLVNLDLSANKISRVPFFSPLPNLSRLNLSSNQLEVFPPTLSKDERKALLPHLKYLDLRSNQIQSVPNQNTGLKDLEELNISKNQIKDLPEQFLASLLSLKTLDASRNELVHIAGDVGQDLVQLHVLKVADNRLGEHEAELNNFITSAPAIQTVDTSENGLLSLPPPYAWKSRALREIKMTGNKVSKLDFSDCGRFWPKLESLYLGQNKLKEIPKEVGNLHSLSCLDLSHNKELRHLPYEMGNLEFLFMLNLQGLKNLSIDQSLLNGSTKAIISYLKSRLTRSVPYFHMKMMIVGAADKGKTTLLRQILQEKTPSSLKTNVATMGVTVKQWSYLQRQSSGHNDKYHVSCWDFAGQEEFYTTHQCFLSQRSLYVLVYNLSLGKSELQMLLPWLLNIQARAPSSPVLVVGTHADKLTNEEFERRRRMMKDRIRDMLRRPGFPMDVSYAEVSCFDEKQMADLRRKIKTLIDNAKLRGQKIMGGLVPSNYLSLEELIKREKAQLERVKSKFPVIHARRLKKLMDECGLSAKMDRAQTEQAINFLHECGVLLHYNDLQTNLSDLYFLDPEWLCLLMGQIITVKQINAFISKDGLIKMSSIPHLLKEPRFPSEFIPEYIRLLERFEVALRQTKESLLIPSQLPKKIPSGITVPAALPGGQIIRRYELCYIPPGFWPRLIARLILFPMTTLFNGHDTRPKVRHLWAGGIFSFWTDKSYFLVELLIHHSNTFDITVPTTIEGTRLLCSIVDNVEALIDEWFPGLRDIDIVHGNHLVTPMSLCPLCDAKPPHCFILQDLIGKSLTTDKVNCPKHNGPVELEILAPDVVVSDLDPQYKVVPGEFVLDESTKNIIGKGGFGEVYKATFRHQTVAVKMFSQKVAAINNTTPNHLIRQEVQILSRLKHPFIISMIGVCMRPKAMLLLEFAELGSLSSFDPYSNLSIPLKHRIAVQVISALAFLHKNKVIYRDLKPGNVLIFSLSLLSKVNAKLSDYGIACYATESGLTQPMGTAGCKAPELMVANTSYMPYTNKVDIYSFGLLLFVMMTNGHRPFDELAAGFEIDKFIMEGRPINDIEYYGCPPWPDMQDLINHCLQYNPRDRPTAQQLFDRLCSNEFVSLKRTIEVECDRDCDSVFTTRFSKQDVVKHIEVWIVSAVGTQGLLSVMNLSQLSATPQGTALEAGLMILSMVAMDSTHVLMGTNTGTILVFDGYSHKMKHKLSSLRSPVLCLLYLKTRENSAYICAGLANGQMAVYHHYSVTSANGNPDSILQIGRGPVKGIKRMHSRLYICCGLEVVVVEVTKELRVVKTWKALDSYVSSYLTYLEVGHESVWTASSKSPIIHIWDIDDGTPKGTLHCDEFINDLLQLPKDKRLTPLQARVTSMLLQSSPSSTLWVGIGSGHILLVNSITRVPLMVVKRHMSAVRGLLSVRALVADKPAHLVLSGGYGFHQRPDSSPQGKEDAVVNSANLLVWDSIMPKMKKTYDDIRKQVEPYMK